ncbi:MAG: 16S rRNA (uracil(1498)-N(3))-methyltransferase [Eubacteriales bacterium]|nr:16S rRNA (uracil(1498)-N(3))-methyltransferase [Eubacteriales bacterium]
MPRFFIEQALRPDQTQWVINGEEARHIASVLRLEPGDPLVLCDGARTDYSARITAIDKVTVTVEILDRQPSQTESPLDITLYQGLPKSDKLDEIIQKAVELGVSRIVPMACERSVARVDARDAARKAERWQKIALAAAKQCGRGLVPIVSCVMSFRTVLDDCQTADLALIPWESERELSLRAQLETAAPKLQPQIDARLRPKIAILIGPEGGFSLSEIDQALAAGILPVTLGRRILRTETAGPTVLAMLGYQFNDF